MNHTETVLYTSRKEALSTLCVTNKFITLRALCHKENLMQKKKKGVSVRQ